MAVDGAELITASVGVVFKLVVDGVGGGVLVINVFVNMVAGVKEVVVDNIDGCVLVVVKVFGVDVEIFVVVDVINVLGLGVVLLTDLANSVIDDNVHGMELFVIAASVVIEVVSNVFFIVVASVDHDEAVNDSDVRVLFLIAVVVCFVAGVVCEVLDGDARFVVMINGVVVWVYFESLVLVDVVVE